RPVVALVLADFPAREQRAGGVELENLRRGEAARARPRRERRPLLVVLQRIDAAMHDPDVILRIGRDAGHRSENPVLLDRKRFRPENFNFMLRRLRRAAAALRRYAAGARSDEHRKHDTPADEPAFHESSKSDWSIPDGR